MLKKFIKYVSQNMLGMVGMSVYILADTYFISVAVGADGITALNLVLPIYNGRWLCDPFCCGTQ